jgi:hypothetical protein
MMAVSGLESTLAASHAASEAYVVEGRKKSRPQPG